MSTGNTTDHQEIAELLPDYAIGAFAERDLKRIAAHLANCKPCRIEFFALLETMSTLPITSGPSAAAKDRLFERAGLRLAGAASRPAASPPPVQIAQVRAKRRLQHLSWIIVAAALIVAIAAGSWSLQLREELQSEQTISDLVSQPSSARELTDREVASDASATLYIDNESDQALLVAANLPELAADQDYDVWLFNQTGERVHAGTFSPDSSGSAQIVVQAPERFSEYWAIGVSSEVLDENDASEAPLIIGGWLQ
ncbi:MAG: anti-sigma factor [Thermomicrobiales bacterium]